MIDLSKKRILVTGGSGFLGSHLLDALYYRGCRPYHIRSMGYDLRDQADVFQMYSDHRPEIVIHLAAVCGGIGANQKRPADFFYQNAIMGLEMIHQAARFGAEKFVQIGTVCSYPKFTPVPFQESDLWNGYPEETNAPYGLAKKMLLTQCRTYREQYGLNAIYLIPVNLYGPKDNFDLETSHVIPAMIKKFLKAKEKGHFNVSLWGDGSPSREFLYVEDAVDAIIKAVEVYDKADPVNIGNGKEITIKELAELIAGLIGFKGQIWYEIDKPNGQPRRCLDTEKAFTEFGFRAQTNLIDGLRKTIDWVKNDSDR